MAVNANLSEQELLEALGRELLGTGLGFGPEDPGRFRRFAEKWIDQNKDKIRDAICHNRKIQQIFERPMQDRLADAAAVADALAALGGRPAVGLLALILLKRGHAQVCGT